MIGKKNQQKKGFIRFQCPFINESISYFIKKLVNFVGSLSCVRDAVKSVWI